MVNGLEFKSKMKVEQTSGKSNVYLVDIYRKRYTSCSIIKFNNMAFPLEFSSSLVSSDHDELFYMILFYINVAVFHNGGCNMFIKRLLHLLLLSCYFLIKLNLGYMMFTCFSIRRY